MSENTQNSEEPVNQAHDGTLSIVPRPDGGLRVTVQLPVGARGTNGTRTVSG